MANKLGQLLVKERIITLDELDEALQSQVVFGGRLGSILIELGLIEEDELARFLSRKLHVPYASQKMFEEISEDVLRLIPREIIQKYRVIPLRVEQRRLSLAMTDPTDLAAIDEIGFRTGLVIVPMVAPEVRIVFSMEKHYGIKREARYLYRQRMPLRRKKRDEPAPPQTANTPPANPFATDQDLKEFPLLDFSDLEQEVTAGKAASIGVGIAHAAPAGPVTLDTVSGRLAEVKDRNEIAEIVIQYAGQEFERAALFLVRGNHIAGWKAATSGRTVQAFEDFQLSLAAPSILKIVAEGKSFYRGPVLDIPENRKMLTALGGGFPETAYLMPISMMGRVVTILYVDGKEADLGARYFALQKLINKVTMAFSILILKNKILAT